MLGQAVSALIRNLLQAFFGGLVVKGIIDADTALALTNSGVTFWGGVIGSVGVYVWSLFNKKVLLSK